MTHAEAARLGGIARAAKLTPARRRAIAKLGFQALVAKRFGGDRRRALDWLVAKGLAALDSDYPAPMRKFFDPGSMPPAEPADLADPELLSRSTELDPGRVGERPSARGSDPMGATAQAMPVAWPDRIGAMPQVVPMKRAG